jgi:phosphatidate cytidylyltransferase
MALNLKTLGTRSLSAFFFVIILVACIWYSYMSLFLLFFLVSLLALHEYFKLAEKLGAKPMRLIGFVAAVVLFLFVNRHELIWLPIMNLGLTDSIFSALLILFPSALLIQGLFTNASNALLNVLHTLLGVIYTVFPLSLLPVISTLGSDIMQYNYFKVLGIIFLIWSNDTLAYLGGSLFGKNKMYERISPGKTWEGTLIGVIGAIGVGFLLNLDHTYASPLIWPVIALLVGIFGTIGDLVESMLKRLAGVKDSGSLMPGHGGALDRFDSLIFVTPFVYAFLVLLNAA